jgi:hypothetical protein
MSANAIAVDNSDNVFITGYLFGDSVHFGNTTLYAGNNNSYVFFIAKYDGSGNVLWARGAGCNSLVQGNGITTDELGNVYVTGTFWGDSVVFGSSVFYNHGGQNATDMFIAKYDSSGNLIWAKGPAGSHNRASGNAIASDGMGHIYVTGACYYSNSITFDTTTLYSNNQNSSAIILKYDNGGDLLWATNSVGGSTATGWGNGITTDKSGNLVVTGAFSAGPFSLGSQTVSTTNYTNTFLSKFDSTGQLLWLKENGGSGTYEGYSVATDLNANIYLSGKVIGNSISFDTVTAHFNNQPQFSIGNDPMFIATFDPSGNTLSATIVASGGDDQSGICTDRSGNVYITGDFRGVNPFVIGRDSFFIDPADSLSEYAFIAKFGNGKFSGIQSVTSGTWLNIYPNPFSGSAFVDYSLPSDSKGATLLVYDLLGRERDSYKLPGNEGHASIDAANLGAGIYFYSMIVDGTSVATRKMVIEK